MLQRYTAVLALLASLCLAPPASAQEAPRRELAAGFTYGHFTGSGIDILGFSVAGTGYLNDWLGLTGDFSWGRDSLGVEVLDAELDVITAMGGVRIRFLNDSPVTPTVRALAGLGSLGVDVNVLGFSAGETVNEFSVILGGSLDFAVTDRFSVRVEPDVLLFDLDTDVIRLSAGGVLGF